VGSVCFTFYFGLFLVFFVEKKLELHDHHYKFWHMNDGIPVFIQAEFKATLKNCIFAQPRRYAQNFILGK